MELLLAKLAKQQMEELGVGNFWLMVAGQHAYNKEASMKLNCWEILFPPSAHKWLRGNNCWNVVGGGLSGPDAQRVNRNLTMSIANCVVGAQRTNIIFQK